MKTRIYIPDIECDSCSKVLNKSFEHTKGITSFDLHQDSVEIEYKEGTIKEKELIKLIESKGFRASTDPFERKSWKERKKDYKENKHKYELESKIPMYTIGIFLILSIISLLMYLLFFQGQENFLGTYGIWIFYLNLSIATIAVAMWHVQAYKTKVTCMTGMMIGMTIGMQTGMLLGAIFGATNGFFMGAMVGMLLGVAVGAYTGKCCGVMGVMEGMMAGIMGGTMGAMITVMMFNDHLHIFMPVYVALNIIILWGMSYMTYEELAEGKDPEKKPIDLLTLSTISVIVMIILTTIMIWGPKAAFLQF